MAASKWRIQPLPSKTFVNGSSRGPPIPTTPSAGPRRDWQLEVGACGSPQPNGPAMIQTRPPILWAVLQREGVWLRWVRHDPQKPADFDASWPTVRKEDWQQWRERIAAEPDRFKLQVKKMLRAWHREDIKKQRTTVGLWMMHKIACVQAPELAAIDKRWTCRVCQRNFKSKGGLGAHALLQGAQAAGNHGSICKACGVQYWTGPRLMTHLRDAPWCVSRLLSAGLRVQEPLPGMGSRKWRQSVVEQFTPAPTKQIKQPLPADGEAYWSDTATAAYKELCYQLFEQDQWESADAVTQMVVATLEKFPLYPDEEAMILEFIQSEIIELNSIAKAELWAEGSVEVVVAALQGANYAVNVEAPAAENQKQSLQDFTTNVENIDWSEVVARCRQHCETPEPSLSTLCFDWEAGELEQSGEGNDPAAILEPRNFIPKRLRTAWEQVTLGQVRAIRATKSFWDHPMAAPFSVLRDSTFN